MDELTFHIFEDITGDTVRRFAEFCKGLPDKAKATLDVCSYGGDVYSGIAILQMIQVCQKTGQSFTGKIWGLAASSASDIVLACNRVEMARTSAIMIHSAFRPDGEHDDGITIANDAQLSVIKSRVPGYNEKDLKEDRWFRADEALEMGLIDAVFDDSNSETAKVAAKCLLNSFIGGFTMSKIAAKTKAEDEIREEELKEEVKEEVEEKAEEVIEEEKKEDIEEVKEESPSMADALEMLIEQVKEIKERLDRLEGGDVQAECGNTEDKEKARMKAVYERISAVCKPAVPKAAITKPVQQEDPKAGLERYKAKYGNMNFNAYIDRD